MLTRVRWWGVICSWKTINDQSDRSVARLTLRPRRAFSLSEWQALLAPLRSCRSQDDSRFLASPEGNAVRKLQRLPPWYRRRRMSRLARRFSCRLCFWWLSERNSDGLMSGSTHRLFWLGARIARDRLQRVDPPNDVLGRDYAKEFAPVFNPQLSLAANHLGQILNDAFK
jgi:hypothetical protein